MLAVCRLRDTPDEPLARASTARHSPGAAQCRLKALPLGEYTGSYARRRADLRSTSPLPTTPQGYRRPVRHVPAPLIPRVAVAGIRVPQCDKLPQPRLAPDSMIAIAADAARACHVSAACGRAPSDLIPFLRGARA